METTPRADAWLLCGVGWYPSCPAVGNSVPYDPPVDKHNRPWRPGSPVSQVFTSQVCLASVFVCYLSNEHLQCFVSTFQCNRSNRTHRHCIPGLPCSCGCPGTNIWLTILTLYICRGQCSKCTIWRIGWYCTCWICTVWPIHPRWLCRPWLCMRRNSHWSVSQLYLWCSSCRSVPCYPSTNPWYPHTSKQLITSGSPINFVTTLRQKC